MTPKTADATLDVRGFIHESESVREYLARPYREGPAASAELVRANRDRTPERTTNCMTRLDVREVPPANRHPTIHETFEDLEPGETLTIVNDHEPKPLFYEFQAEVESFDADGYEVERIASDEFVARFPKRER